MIATFGRGGFIGSYLPAEFVGVDCDIRTEPWEWPTWLSVAPEAALNLACVQPARGVFSEDEYWQTNAHGFWHVCIWAFSNGIRKVITVLSQKTAIEGEIGKLVRTDRDVMETINGMVLNEGERLIGLRLPPVIGPGPYIAKSGLGQMIEGAKQGRIEVWGGPSNSRAVISVHDAVSAIEFLAHSDLQGVFSIGIDLSLEQEARTVRSVFGGELVYRPEIGNQISQDIPVTGIPGWEPRVSFEEMVRELKGAE